MKKRKNKEIGNKTKKRKYELLVGWGEGLEEDKGPASVLEDWVKRKDTGKDKTERMKDLESVFKAEMANKYTLENPKKEKVADPKPPKLSLAEQLKQAAVGCKKITGWIVKTKKVTEWDDDLDLPALEEIDVIEEREIEKAKKKEEDVKMFCIDIIAKMIMETEAIAAAVSVMDRIVEEAWKSIKLEGAWRMIEVDPELESEILTRIRKRTEMEANQKETEWRNKKKEILKRQADRAKERIARMRDIKDVLVVDEKVEHDFLDSYLEKVNVKNVDMKFGSNWENDELSLLDNVLTDRADIDINTLNEDILKGYIGYTDLNSKRIIGAENIPVLSKYTEVRDIILPSIANGASVSGLSTAVSNKDINMSANDIRVSTEDMDITSKDIFVSTTGYSWSVNSKRKLEDDGVWWLPSQWRSSHRARWPSSSTTSRRRRGGWSRHTDPGLVDDLIMETNNHKQLWKQLRLTEEMPGEMGYEGEKPDDPPRGRGGGVGLREDGACPGDDGVLGLLHRDGEDNLNIMVNMGGQTLDITEKGEHDHLPGGHIQGVQGGGEQKPAVIKKRRYFRQLRGGASRAGIRQTDISTFTVPKITGVGGGSGEFNTKKKD